MYLDKHVMLPGWRERATCLPIQKEGKMVRETNLWTYIWLLRTPRTLRQTVKQLVTVANVPLPDILVDYLHVTFFYYCLNSCCFH